MRKLTTFFAVLVLLLLALGSSSVIVAQEATPAATAATNTLKDVLTNDGRFTTFLAAMDSAGLDNLLTGSTPFTVFAPTDGAFTAALGLLGWTSDQAMSSDNHLALVKILSYHIVGGKNFFRTLSRGANLHTLEGSHITTSLVSVGARSSVIYLNGGASSLSVGGGGTDLTASNGVIQVVDAVLLPSDAGLPTGYARMAFFSPDAGSVDVYVNGAELGSALAYKTVGDWTETTVGNYVVDVVPAGGAIGDAIATSTLAVGAGTHTTVAAVGSSANSTITLANITEDYSAATATGKVRVTFFHAVEGGPGANIVVDDATLTENLMFPGSAADGSNDGVFSTELNVGEKHVQVVDNANPATVLASGTWTVTEGHNYLIAVVGTADAPEIVVSDTDTTASSGS